jgi:hypothetical protein
MISIDSQVINQRTKALAPLLWWCNALCTTERVQLNTCMKHQQHWHLLEDVQSTNQAMSNLSAFI